MQEEKLRAAFKMFDKDNSGSINSQEVKQQLGVGKKFGDDQMWEDIIKEVDVNNDGEITYDEFKKMMKKFLEKTIQDN